MSIELRVSNVSPPTAEPKRTIYRDIVNLPDPVLLGLTVRYFNYDDVDLYFKVTGSAVGYTFGTVNLGLLADGTDAYINLDEFASRAKPTVETEEIITITLKAYTDAAYTNLKWTFNREVHVQFINSNDAAYTTDYSNTFDDGTVQEWAGNGTDFGVATDYVLSAPYSLKQTGVYGYPLYPTYDILIDDAILIKIGGTSQSTNPYNKWIRIIVPLPSSSAFTLTVRVTMAGLYSYRFYKAITTPSRNAIYAIIDCRANGGTVTTTMWMDDFKIISK